jgi:hypothetical protein
VQLNHRKWLLAGCAAGMISISLGACSQHTASGQAKAAPSGTPATTPTPAPASSQAALNPNGVCTSDDTLNTVRRLVAQEAQKHVHSAGAKEALNDDSMLSDLMSLKGIVVAKYDQSVKKAYCEAQLKLIVPEGMEQQVAQAAMMNNAFAGNSQLGTAAPEPVDKGGLSSRTSLPLRTSNDRCCWRRGLGARRRRT